MMRTVTALFRVLFCPNLQGQQVLSYGILFSSIADDDDPLNINGALKPRIASSRIFYIQSHIPENLIGNLKFILHPRNECVL
jgi:hypothetical protein